MHNTLFNPRLPVLADQQEFLAIKKDTNGDKDTEWLEDARFHLELAGVGTNTNDHEADSFIKHEFFAAHRLAERVAATGTWKISPQAIQATTHGVP